MPDTGLLFLAMMSFVVGTLVVLFPRRISQLSAWLNQTIRVLDEPMMRHRYVVGLLAFAASYAFFRLALLVPNL